MNLKKNSKRILLLGGRSMLGTALKEAFKGHEIIAPRSDELDITSGRTAFSKIISLKPDMIINSAGYTEVDGAEKEKDSAYNVNTEAIKTLVDAANNTDSQLIQISTDYVFDGEKECYLEHDETNPINYYGLTKALAEQHIQKECRDFIIIRTSALFGPGKKNNFVDKRVKQMKENIKNGLDLRIVSDQHTCPTYTPHLAKGIKRLIEDDYPSGIYHLTNSGQCSWFGFTKKIAENFGRAEFTTMVKPFLTSTQRVCYKGITSRPKNGILKDTKTNIVLPRWEDALKEYMKKTHLKNRTNFFEQLIDF